MEHPLYAHEKELDLKRLRHDQAAKANPEELIVLLRTLSLGQIRGELNRIFTQGDYNEIAIVSAFITNAAKQPKTP